MPTAMLRLNKWPTTVAVACLLAVTPAIVSAAELVGRVVGVSDGDTVTVLDGLKMQHKVRLAGIDAPEKGQPFGTASKARLSSLVFGKQVIVEWTKTDRYGRLVGKVVVGKVDANLAQVRDGYAWHFKDYQREQSPADWAAYAKGEFAARHAGRGLWADKAPEAPWLYRADRRLAVDN